MRRVSTLLCAAAIANDPTKSKKEELMKQRVQVSVKEPATAASMESFRDIRPPIENETPETMRRRLTYQSRYRGMVEMDIIFGSFAQARLQHLSETMLKEYDNLLRQYDNDLFNWLVSGQAPPQDIGVLGAWRELSDFVKNNREQLLGHKL